MIKLDLNYLHVVYKPQEDSDLKDIYRNSKPLSNLANEFKSGVSPKRIHAIYNTKEEAVQEATRIYELFSKVMQEINFPEDSMDTSKDKLDLQSAKGWFLQAKDKFELLNYTVQQLDGIKEDQALKGRFATLSGLLNEIGMHLDMYTDDGMI